MTKVGSTKDKNLNKLLALDDEWEKIYSQFRIKEGYTKYQYKANKHILTIFFEDEKDL